MATISTTPEAGLDASERRGRRKKAPPPTLSAGLLSRQIVSIYRGDFLTESGRHTGPRRRAIFVCVVYAFFAGAFAAWLFVHPGLLRLRAAGAVPLGASAVLVMVLGIVMVLASRGLSQVLIKAMRWARRAAVVFDFAARCPRGREVYRAGTGG